MYTRFQLYTYDYYAIHFIRAGSVVGWVQSLSIPQSSPQTQGRDASVGNSTTSEHLPTRHSERPLHVQVFKSMCLGNVFSVTLCTGR